MQFMCHEIMVRDELREHGEEACGFVLDRTGIVTDCHTHAEISKL